MQNLLISLLVLLFLLIGFLRLVIEFAVHSTEKKEIEKTIFKISEVKIFSNLLSIASFFIGSIVIFFFCAIILVDFNNIELLPKLIGVSMLLLGLFILYKTYELIVLFIQYYRFDHNKIIEINRNEKKLILKNSKNRYELELDFKSLKKIQVNLSSCNKRNPKLSYEYVRIISEQDLQIIITSLLIKPENLRILLKDYNPETIFKNTNYIK